MFDTNWIPILTQPWCQLVLSSIQGAVKRSLTARSSKLVPWLVSRNFEFACSTQQISQSVPLFKVNFLYKSVILSIFKDNNILKVSLTYISSGLFLLMCWFLDCGCRTRIFTFSAFTSSYTIYYNSSTNSNERFFSA